MAPSRCTCRTSPNLERAFAVLAETDPAAAISAARSFAGGIDILRAHPLVGRVIRGDLRELVISFGRNGYVALYRFVPGRDEVRVLAIRHQKEIDYP